jgi:hypothetical protein
MKQDKRINLPTKRQVYVVPTLEQHTNWVKVTLMGSGIIVPIGTELNQKTAIREFA